MVARRIDQLPSLAEIDTERAQRRLRHFVRQAWPVVEPFAPFKPNWHLDAIADHLEAVEAGQIRNLLVTMPPRMGKSLTISVFYPAWRWIDRPGTRFLCASYSQDLATEHSLATRRVIESDWYQQHWGEHFQLAGDANLKMRFENDQRGVRVATSVGGVVTGRGGDRLVVDDPHNVRDAGSEAIRTATLQWWDQAMSTRLNDPVTGARIVVMQRVHEQDLAGHLIEQGGYVHLNLPMEYEPEAVTFTGFGQPDPRTAPGELLAPSRVGPAEVADLKLRLGSYAYAGQYQQRPSPAEGGILKRHWWRFWHVPGQPLDPVRVETPVGPVHCPVVPLPYRFDQTIQSWDMAFKDAVGGSFVVGQVWSRDGAQVFLRDQVRDRLDFPDSVYAVEALSRQWPDATAKLVEDKANGPAIISTLTKRIPGLIAVPADISKAARAHAVAPFVEAGNVVLPHPRIASWVEGLIEECAALPTGAYDDQADALTQAVDRLLKGVSAGDIDAVWARAAAWNATGRKRV